MLCLALVEEVAQDVVDYAQASAPVDTGFLRDSIHVEPGDDAMSRNVVVGAFYGVYQEFGTRFQSGTPFLIPGVEQAAEDVPATFDRLVEDLL